MRRHSADKALNILVSVADLQPSAQILCILKGQNAPSPVTEEHLKHARDEAEGIWDMTGNPAEHSRLAFRLDG
jgi:hypothetical protein